MVNPDNHKPPQKNSGRVKRREFIGAELRGTVAFSAGQDAIKGTRFPDVIAISSNPMPGYQGKRLFFVHLGFDILYRRKILLSQNAELRLGRSLG